MPSRLRLILVYSIILFGLRPCIIRATEYRAASAAAVARVASVVKQGDTVVLTNGLWTDAQLTFRAEGSESKPILLRAESPGKVILTGKSWLRIAGYHIVVQDLVFQGCTTDHDLVSFRLDPKEGAPAVKKSFSLILKAHHCRLTNCAFLDCDPPDPSNTARWVTLYGTHNRVDHCLMRGKTTAGAMLAVFLGGEIVDHRIDGNHFALREHTQGTKAETLRVGDGDTTQDAHVIVESNLFEACNGGNEIITNRSSGNTYRHNTFRSCEGSISLRAGTNCVVEGNYLLGDGRPLTGGVVVTDAGHRVINNYFAGLQGTGVLAPVSFVGTDRPADGPATGSLVGFNTIVHCKTGLAVLPAPAAPAGCTIANNLFADCESALFDQADALSHVLWTANIVHSGNAGPLPETGILTFDPKVVADKDGIWRPAAGSDARGAAQGDHADITEDIDGQPREGAKDIGCDQASSAAVEHPVLAASQAGASWMHRTIADHRGARSVSREREVQ